MNEYSECITTLPLSPVASPNIGLLSAPFVMDVFGKKLGKSCILSLNTNGSKLAGQIRENHVSGFLSSVNSLGVNSSYVWRDDQKENQSLVSCFFYQLVRDGHVCKEKADVIKCECGAVECLAEVEMISPSRSICLLKNGKRYCQICNTEAVLTNESVYLFKFPFNFNPKIVFPDFYRKELKALSIKFQGCKFLISRSRSSSVSVFTEDGKVLLDVDFVWQMFLSVLCSLGHNPIMLIGGSKNLMACCFSMIMFQLINKRDIALVIPPYFLGPGRKPLKGREFLVENLFFEFNKKTIRLLLSTAVNWSKKESVLDFRQAHLIAKMAYRIFGQKQVSSMEEIAADFSGIKIKNLLAQYKKTREVINSRELYGIL